MKNFVALCVSTLAILVPNFAPAQQAVIDRGGLEGVPEAMGIQPVAKTPVKIGDKTYEATLQYYLDNSKVIPLPVWVAEGNISFKRSLGDPISWPDGKSLNELGELANMIKIVVSIRDLTGANGNLLIVEDIIKKDIEAQRNIRGNLQFFSPRINPSGYWISLHRRIDDRSVSDRIPIPRGVVGFGQGSVEIPVDASVLKNLADQGVKRDDLYVLIEGSIWARFRREQYKVSLSAVTTGLIDLGNKIDSHSRNNTHTSTLLYFPDAQGEADQRQKAVDTIRSMVRLNIEVRQDARVDLGAVDRLAQQFLEKSMQMIDISTQDIKDRVAVIIGDMVTISAVVDEIKQYSKSGADARKMRLKNMINEYSRRKDNNQVKVDTEFDSLYILGSAKASVDVNSGHESEDLKKIDLDKLDDQLKTFAESFRGKASKLNGISFNQESIMQSSKELDAEISRFEFTEGFSYQEWPLIAFQDQSPTSAAKKLAAARQAVAEAIVALERAKLINSTIDPPPILDILLTGKADDISRLIKPGGIPIEGVSPEVFGAWFTGQAKFEFRDKLNWINDLRVMQPDKGLNEFYKARKEIFGPLIEQARKTMP